MLKNIPKLEVVLIAVVITACTGVLGPQALAQRARVPQTGQTTCWDAAGSPINCAGTGQDEDIQAGVDWPTPRFTDRGNGTVRDNLTGLIWLQNPFCTTLSPVDWLTALSHAKSLANGQCGLMDGSKVGDWRVPTVKELLSLIDHEFAFPALSNAAGTGQSTEGDPFALDVLGSGSGGFWSSTTVTDNPRNVWVLSVGKGVSGEFPKEGILSYLWPVRGGN